MAPTVTTDKHPLRVVRETLGISRLKLDEMAGVGLGNTRAIEDGRNGNPSLSLCAALVGALREAGARGVDLESVFGPFARPRGADSQEGAS